MLRKMLIWMTAALCFACMGAYAEEAGRLYAVQVADGACLLDAQGNAATQPGEYRMIYELTGTEEGRYFAGEQADGESAGYALIDEQGERLTGFEYQTLEYAGGRIIFMKNERWGVMDLEGNVLTEPVYTALVSNGAGGFLAQKTDPYDDSPDAVYLLDGNLAESQTGVKITGGLYPLSDGLMAAASPENGLYGYLNVEGKWALQPVYRWAGAFEDGLAHVTGEQAGGLIDREGRWILPPEYGYLSYEGKDSMIAAVRGNEILVIHPETLEASAVCSAEGAAGYSLENGGAVVSLAEEAYFTGMNAETIRLEGCRGVNQWGGMEGRMIVHMGEYGTPSIYLYDLAGNAIAGPYQDIMPLGEEHGEMYYVFTSFEAVQSEYGEGLVFWDEKPGTRKCGVLSPDGEELCVFDAEYISCVGEGRMLIQQDGQAGFADFAGNVYAYIGDSMEMSEAE